MTDDKDARIAALEAELAERTRERDEHAKWRMALADKLHDRETELADERKRWVAAEVLLRELASLVAGECPRVLDEDSDGDSRLALNIDAHFARYKD